jgi:hypothetical protein
LATAGRHAILATMATRKTKPVTKSEPGGQSKSASKPKPAAEAKGAKAKGAKRPAAALEKKLVRATDALKKEFGKIQLAVRKLRGAGTESFDALYELVGRVLASDPPVYVGGGYRTKEDFIAAELPGETLRSVNRNVLVARCFSPEEEARHGIAFLEEVALYAKELTGAAEPPPAIDLDKLSLTLPGKGGAAVRKKARDATIDDVRRARRGLRKGGETRRAGSPLEAALRAALGKHRPQGWVSVPPPGERASFGTVPLPALPGFPSAPAKVKVPADRS